MVVDVPAGRNGGVTQYGWRFGRGSLMRVRPSGVHRDAFVQAGVGSGSSGDPDQAKHDENAGRGWSAGNQEIGGRSRLRQEAILCQRPGGNRPMAV